GADGQVSAHGITITADAPSSSEVSAQATSGAGGGSVGLAGSFALVISTITTTAGLYAPLANANGGDVALTATESSTAMSKALPGTSGGGGGSSVGIGASVALSIVNVGTRAEVGAAVALANVNALSAPASSNNTTTNQAKPGE